jgi:hypothetical protein
LRDQSRKQVSRAAAPQLFMSLREEVSCVDWKDHFRVLRGEAVDSALYKPG